MFRPSFTQRVIVVGLLTALLAGGSALAQRGDRGRGGGDGGGRSSSRGGGGGESRSFSRGGGESRSFSRGGGGESRSFSRGGGGESRSFSRGGDSRSFSRGDSGSSRSFRSFSGDSGRSSRSVIGSDRGSSRQFRPSDSGSSRSFDRGSTQFRSPSRPDGDSSVSRRSSGEIFRSDQSRSRTADSGDRSSANRRQFSQGDRSNQGGQQFQGRRASEEQVRNFLQLRDGSSQRQADSRGDSRDGRSFRGDEQRRTDVARRLDSDREGVNRDRGDANRGDRDVTKNFQRRDRDGDDRNRDFDRDRDFDGDRDRDRDFANRGGRQGRDGDDRDYQRWRDGARSRDRGDDNRDWSGRWRDGDRFKNAHDVRDHWRGRWRDRDHDDFDFPFVVGWWGGHNHWHGNRWNWWGDYAHRYNRPYYWWTWATAPLLTNWVSYGWNRPYYWDYGPGEYIYIDDGVCYVNGRWYQPAPVFYERTVEIVEQAPELTADEAAQLEWLPLGVFAVVPEGTARADSNVLVQLAVTKDGVISSTASQQPSGVAYPIEGTVQKETQRAVWSYTNERNQRIVMETSVYNLTQSEATGLVHYGPNDFRVVQLVRLEDPGQGASSGGTVGELPTP